MSCITIEDVRHYVADRAMGDNPLLMDIAYTDDEIRTAMKAAAREYNSIPPLGVDRVCPSCLSDETNIFFDGIAAALLTTERLRRGRNDVDYSMGGAQAATEGKRLQHLDQEIRMMRDRFKEAAIQRKVHINTQDYFGRIV